MVDRYRGIHANQQITNGVIVDMSNLVDPTLPVSGSGTNHQNHGGPKGKTRGGKRSTLSNWVNRLNKRRRYCSGHEATTPQIRPDPYQPTRSEVLASEIELTPSLGVTCLPSD
jgi:hypothetical protein